MLLRSIATATLCLRVSSTCRLIHSLSPSSPFHRIMSTVQSLLPIAIIGGGPAGLTAARIFQLHNIPCKVYENESAANARNQGGSLDLHEHNGLIAIEQCGLTQQFNALSRPEGDCMRILDKTGKVHYSEEPPAVDQQQDDSSRGRRPEIDRLDLRNMLLDSLAQDTVQWGHALAAIKPLPASASDDGDVCRWELTFKNGATERAAVVIGADGAWSRVRPLLSHHIPQYSDITFIDLTIHDVSANHPHLSSLVGPGMTFLLGDSRAIIAQMNGKDKLRTYAILRAPDGWTDDHSDTGGAFLSAATPAAIETLITRYFNDWHEPAKDLMRKADVASMAVRKLHAMPAEHTFTHSADTRLVSAVGDAAHVMGPNGEGVNLAMLDAAQLAAAISTVLTSHIDTAAATSTAAALSDVVDRLAAAIVECEKAMFDRWREELESPVNFDLFLSEDAAVKFTAMMQQMMAAAALQGAQGDAAPHEAVLQM